MDQELMLELSREPRIVGTRGYDRALDIVGSTLERAGLHPERRVRKSGRAIPLRSDVLLFEDGTQGTPFAGLRERWDPNAIPTMPRPMAFDHNPESAEVRGQIVRVGAGLSADFERVIGLGVPLEGKILLATMELAPAERRTTVREMAERAAAAGAVGLLVAPTQAADTPSPLALTAEAARPLWVEENTVGATPLALPTAPIRAIEAEAIDERLRTKRVRGSDGKATPIRLGPGPVEATIAVECPLVLIQSVPELVVTRGSGDGAPELRRPVSLVDVCDRPLGGAFELTAEVLMLIRGYDDEARKLSASIAPEFGATARKTEYVFGPFLVPSTHSLLGPLTLESAGATPSGGEPANLVRTALIPGHFKHFERVAAEFGSDLSSRSDAAARFLAYESEVRNFSGDPPAEDPSWKAIAASTEAAAAALSLLR